MTCEWKGKLEQYVDAELPKAELANVEAHLRTCQSCAADAVTHTRLKRLTRLAGANAYVPTLEFRSKVATQIRSKQRQRWVWWPQLAVAAACIILIAGAAAIWSQRTAARQRTIAELADVHLATLASTNPVDVISTDRHTVKPWFAGKLPFTFNVPELQNTRFKLVGGRVSYIEHAPAAQLFLDVGRHHVSVFVAQDRQPFSRLNSGVSVTRDGFNVDTWRTGDLRFAAISDAEAGALVELANLFKAAAQQQTSTPQGEPH
jgi:anti-sigma factor RsiW